MTKNKSFTVFFDTEDESLSQERMGDPSEVVVKTITPSNSIYVGYKKKPVYNYFIELKTPNTNSSKMDVKRWNGTQWIPTNFIDETKGFKKSNFLYLDKDQELIKSTVNGVEAYWIKISIVSGTTSAIGFNGINIVFCSEYDLMKIEPNIKQFYPREVKSQILSACTARDEIMRRINNTNDRSYKVLNPLLGIDEVVSAEDLTAFDIMNIEELVEVASYLTIYHNYRNRSDAETEDAYSRKSQQMWEKYEANYARWNGMRLTLDLNKNGKVDEAEKIESVAVGRFVR